MTPGRSRTPTIARAALAALAVAALALAVTALLAHRDSARGFTHTVGLFVVLAELLREGVLYPHAPTADLVYATFYHPLAFAPIALLPGSGVELVPNLRVLVGVETLAGIGLAAWLARTPLTVLLALACVPVAHGLLGMRDDPRATLWCLAALAAGAKRPRTAGVLLGFAFLTKAVAPLAPGAALLLATARAGRAVTLRFVVAGAVTAAALVAFVQWGLDADLLGNGLRWGLLEPARAARTWAEVLAKLGSDLAQDLWTPWLLGVSALVAIARTARRQADAFDLLVLAAWLKTVFVYRSPGTDLNHLFDLCVFAALHVGRLVGVAPVRNLVAAGTLALTLVLGDALRLQPAHRVLVPRGELPPLHGAPVLANVLALRAADPIAFTLCEDPLLGWLLAQGPVQVDPYLTFAALRRHPGIRERWFGPITDLKALRRVVLMHDPFAAPSRPETAEWYRRLHFDQELIDELKAHWTLALASPNGTVFVR